MRLRLIIFTACFCASIVSAGNASNSLPPFTATSLTGQTVTEQKLVGSPTILVVTPSKAAAENTRQWAQALRKNFDPEKVQVRDVLAIDLPFFMTERDAIDRAKQRIPKQYYDQTWLLDERSLEESMGIPPASEDAFVLVLNRRGQMIARVQGTPTEARIDQITQALSSIRN